MYTFRPIDPSKIDWYLNRELNNFDFMHSLTDDELDLRLSLLEPSPIFKLPLFREQKIMFLLGTMQDNFIFWADMGIGKTALALNLINWRYEKGRPALVLVPDVTNIANWIPECKKFVPHLKVIPLIGNRDKRINDLSKNADVFIINYSGLNSILSTGGRSINISPSDVEGFAKGFKTVIYDEMVEVKNPKSISFQVAKVLAKTIPYRYGLTGRPIGRIALDFWAQFYVIDNGETLGRNFEIFKQAFFTPKVTPFAIKWVPNPDRKERFGEILKNKAIYFQEKHKVLPVRASIPITLSDEAAQFYKKLKGDLIADLKQDAWRAKIKNPFVKFRQVCSGYLIVADKELDEETGNEVVISTDEISFDNPKEKVLEQLVDSLPLGSKMVIFYAFTPSGKRITDKLNTMRVKHLWLYGGTKDKSEVLTKFTSDPTSRILVTNLNSGSTGLNLQVANYEFFYENADNIKTRAQAEARCQRRGQEKQVYIYDVIVTKSVEEKLLKFIKEGESLFDELVRGTDLGSKSSFSTSLRSKKAIIDALGDI